MKYLSLFSEDPRLHACIVCASISCPNLRMEAFRPDTVDQQMDQQMRDFLMNDKKGESKYSPHKIAMSNW